MLWSFCGGIIPSGCGSGEVGLLAYAEEWEAQPTIRNWLVYVSLLKEVGDILRARNRSSDRIAMALIIRIVTVSMGIVSSGVFHPQPIHQQEGGYI